MPDVIAFERPKGAAGRVLSRILTRLLVGVLTLALLAIAVVLQPSLLPASARGWLGLEPGGNHLLVSSKGSYAFLKIQPGTHDMPVTYSSCQTLHYVINPNGAPARFSNGAFIRDAVAEISQVSGLKFQYDGTSSLNYRTRNYQSGPILFSFDELPQAQMYDHAVAMGGSDTLDRIGRPVYSTGAVTFRRSSFALIAGRPSGEKQARAIALHEIGHVLGLDHVNDRDEIMNPSGGHVLDLGPGDRTGLKILGSGPCY